MNGSSSPSALGRLVPVRARSGRKRYSTRQPRRTTCQGSSRDVISPPSSKRSPSATISSNASSVITSPSVVRIAASRRVPRERPAGTADVDHVRVGALDDPALDLLGHAVRRARDAGAEVFPIVTMSGRRSHARSRRPAPR